MTKIWTTPPLFLFAVDFGNPSFLQTFRELCHFHTHRTFLIIKLKREQILYKAKLIVMKCENY